MYDKNKVLKLKQAFFSIFYNRKDDFLLEEEVIISYLNKKYEKFALKQLEHEIYNKINEFKLPEIQDNQILSNASCYFVDEFRALFKNFKLLSFFEDNYTLPSLIFKRLLMCLSCSDFYLINNEALTDFFNFAIDNYLLNKNKWVEYDMSNKSKVFIGRGKDCDIVLDRINISSKHAKLMKNENGYTIGYEGNNVGIILNNMTLSWDTPLRDKDVFEINGIKFIYSQNKLFYQLSENGVRLDAFDIVKTVRLKFKKKDISQHVNFSAEPGQFVAFVGGSGAGKSTFMKCISGVSKPTSGKVLINGNDLYNNYDVLKNLIGYVPQENIIFDDLSLIKMLRYAANLRMPDDSTKEEKEKI